MSRNKAAKIEDPNKVGAGKFWAWQSRGFSLAASFIIFTYLNLYCTDFLLIPAGTLGILLMVSKIFDGVTDLFAGYLIDNTNTKWGKARPYEFAIFGVWLCTWLMFSTPAGASLTLKCVWVFLMYTFANSVFATLLNASASPYTIRAFGSKEKIAKVSAYGGIVITLGCVLVSVSFPLAMGALATSASGWSKLVGLYSLPIALIGILRFIFVKEDAKVEEIGDDTEKLSLAKILEMLKKNKYIYPVAAVTMLGQMIGGLNTSTYYFKWIVGNTDLLSVMNALALPLLLLMVVFPKLMHKYTVKQIICVGSLIAVGGGVLAFFAGSNMLLLIIAYVMLNCATLAPSYLTGLMLMDCGTYNGHILNNRMDGSVSAVNGFLSKVGNGIGTAMLGILLAAGGYDGALAAQSSGSLFTIRLLYGIVPALLWLITFFVMRAYKLDKVLADMHAAEAPAEPAAE